MKWKQWVRMRSVTGPRVAVRTQFPWPLRASLATSMLLAAFGAGFAVHAWVSGSAGPGSQLAVDVQEVRAQHAQAVVDRDREAAAAANWESRLKVAQSAQEQVAAQMKALEDENARLRADLAFFESLLPTPANAKGLVIRSFRMQPDADAGVMRYRLLVQQSGRPERDFVGAVSLTVNLERDGQQDVLQLSDPGAPDAGAAALAFRHYQRVEGSFPVPAGARVRSVLVRIVSGGETRAQQTFTL